MTSLTNCGSKSVPLAELFSFPIDPTACIFFEFPLPDYDEYDFGGGDRRFGVLLFDQFQEQTAAVGCCAEIINISGQMTEWRY